MSPPGERRPLTGASADRRPGGEASPRPLADAQGGWWFVSPSTRFTCRSYVKRSRCHCSTAGAIGPRVQPCDCQNPGMTGSTDSPASVAAAYFDAWMSNDIERVQPLLHDEVAFDGALGSTRGVDETIAGLGRMFAMTEQVEVLHAGSTVPTSSHGLARTETAGPLAIVNWSHVEAGASPGSG